MKTLVLASWLTVAATTALAQGTLEYRGTVIGCESSGCSGQIYWGPAGISDPLSPQLVAAGAPFSIPTSGQYMGTASIPSPGGATITLQARAWLVGTGPSWETATVRGFSSPIQAILNTVPPTPIVMLPTFAVPEPSGLVLGGAGLLLAILCTRRRSA